MIILDLKNQSWIHATGPNSLVKHVLRTAGFLSIAPHVVLGKAASRPWKRVHLFIFKHIEIEIVKYLK